MKYVSKLNVTLLFLAATILTACDEDDNTPVIQLEGTTVADLNAVNTKNFTLFSFADNAVILNTDSATAKWDIGFRGTTIILNGGVSGPGQAAGQLVNGIFEELQEAPTDGYAQDSQTTKAIQGSGGWYTYTGEAPSGPKHAVLPNAGKLLVLKTADGKYVNMEILSYYQGNPSTTTETFADLATRPAARFYTFRFIHQKDGSTNLKTTSQE
ncbi:MAG: HmuY family protein [Cyclobacteriaceae bacterium]|nr:HmuY family protein [Cyclobacteriaceae bacterium]